MLGHLGEYCPYGADYTTLYENMLKTELEFLGVWKQDDFQGMRKAIFPDIN